MTAPDKDPKKDNPDEEHHYPSGFIDFIMHHKIESVTYLVLFFGLVFSIFHHFIGNLIVGVVLGLYFGKNIQDKWDESREYIANNGVFKGFIILASILALLIVSPGFVIGALIGTLLQPFFGQYISSPFDNPPK